MTASVKQIKHDAAKLAFSRDAVLSDDCFSHKVAVRADMQEAVHWIAERSALQAGSRLYPCSCLRLLICF